MDCKDGGTEASVPLQPVVPSRGVGTWSGNVSNTDVENPWFPKEYDLQMVGFPHLSLPQGTWRYFFRY